MEGNVARVLAQQCLPALQAKGISGIKNIASVEARRIQGVWTGEGGIAEVSAEDADGVPCSFIAKSIGSYKNVGDELGLQDHWSYYNELSFYETELPDKICSAGALCPRPLFVDRRTSSLAQSGRKASRVEAAQNSSRLQNILRQFRVKPADGDGGDEKDEGTICMTKLPGGRWSPSQEGTRHALTWLARLHSLFWGNERVSNAVALGVSDQACFWHLDNRQVEFGRMSAKSRLRMAAAGIDARLKADAMQTLCHGDPKGANIMWDRDQGLSMYDFQWLGKAPPTKDLAYFFATAAMNRGRWDKAEEEELLKYYHGELSKFLESQGDAAPTFEYLCESYTLAVVDYGRWIEGGFPWGNMSLIEGHIEKFFKKLGAAGVPKSETECRDLIFQCFPP